MHHSTSVWLQTVGRGWSVSFVTKGNVVVLRQHAKREAGANDDAKEIVHHAVPSLSLVYTTAPRRLCWLALASQKKEAQLDVFHTSLPSRTIHLVPAHSISTLFYTTITNFFFLSCSAKQPKEVSNSRQEGDGHKEKKKRGLCGLRGMPNARPI